MSDSVVTQGSGRGRFGIKVPTKTRLPDPGLESWVTINRSLRVSTVNPCSRNPFVFVFVLVSEESIRKEGPTPGPVSLVGLSLVFLDVPDGSRKGRHAPSTRPDEGPPFVGVFRRTHMRSRQPPSPDVALLLLH